MSGLSSTLGGSRIEEDAREDAMLGRLGFAALALAAATLGAMSAGTIGDVSINLPAPVEIL